MFATKKKMNESSPPSSSSELSSSSSKNLSSRKVLHELFPFNLAEKVMDFIEMDKENIAKMKKIVEKDVQIKYWRNRVQKILVLSRIRRFIRAFDEV